MRDNPNYQLDDLDAIAELVRAYPWCTFVSAVPGSGLVASHYPVILDEDAYAADRSIVLLSHMGRPDEKKHQLGEHDVLVIVQGPHGYISPSWYGDGPGVPTWNFVVAHLTGPAEILADQENLMVLDRLVERFEQVLPEPRLLHATSENSEYAHRIVHGTAGFRIAVRTIEAKEKMSQDKPPAVVERVIDELRGAGPYHHPVMAQRIASVQRGNA